MIPDTAVPAFLFARPVLPMPVPLLYDLQNASRKGAAL